MIKTKSDIDYVLYDQSSMYVVYQAPFGLYGQIYKSENMEGLVCPLYPGIYDGDETDLPNSHLAIVNRTPDDKPYDGNMTYLVCGDDLLKEIFSDEEYDELKQFEVPVSEVLDDFEVAYYPVESATAYSTVFGARMSQINGLEQLKQLLKK